MPEEISRAKTYRNISAKIKFFGLEIGDWGTLAAAAGALFAISNCMTVNLLLTAAIWVWMFRVKGRRAEGYTLSRIMHHTGPQTFIVDTERNPNVEIGR